MIGKAIENKAVLEKCRRKGIRVVFKTAMQDAYLRLTGQKVITRCARLSAGLKVFLQTFESLANLIYFFFMSLTPIFIISVWFLFAI